MWSVNLDIVVPSLSDVPVEELAETVIKLGYQVEV